MKLLIAGDLLPYDRVAKLFDSKQYETVLGQVKQLVTKVDYSIVNFECPICVGNEKPIEKLGPIHKCSKSVIGALQYAGFKCVTLANNHFRDLGDEGCLNTLKELDNNEIDHVGGGKNVEEAAGILYREINDKRLAVINCCEHEFSIATGIKAGSNPLNPIQQYYSIQESRKNADYVVVIVHGGHEHYQFPSPRMVETYRFYIDAGADAVVNHHQHCFSGYEVYHGKPIFYGLGNFCFDKPIKRSDIWNEGYMVELDFTEERIVSYTIHPYLQCDSRPNVELIINKSDFKEKIDGINEIIADEKKLSSQFERLCQAKCPQKESLLSPYSGTFLQRLHHKGLIPSPLSHKRLLALSDHIDCESHRDTTLYYLRKSHEKV